MNEVNEGEDYAMRDVLLSINDTDNPLMLHGRGARRHTGRRVGRLASRKTNCGASRGTSR